MSKEFIRQDSMRFSKLGKNRKKLQKWRKPKGRDSKMRLNMTGYPRSPTVGHKSSKEEFGKVQGLVPVLVKNEKDLGKVVKGSGAILSGKVGAKKKLEIIKKAEELGIKVLNLKQESKK